MPYADKEKQKEYMRNYAQKQRDLLKQLTSCAQKVESKEK
jgi:hypothetical protein